MKSMKALSESDLARAYSFLKNGDTVRAKTIIEDVIAGDYENPEVIFALRCINFWADKIADPEGDTPEAKSDFLLSCWKRFLALKEASDIDTFENCAVAVRTVVFSMALDGFLDTLQAHRNPNEGDLYRKAGICHKKLGEYETALSFFGEAVTLLSNDPAVLAQMADCYSLCGDERAAKVLFRDAFFSGASQIDLAFLDCRMILNLIKKVEKKGFTHDVMPEWIPVYGVLYGVFNIKRELRPHEAAKLRQAIFALENELRETPRNSALITPRLVNHYFWLIDHLTASREDRSKIEDILRKINLLDIGVYKQYAGIQEK
jgi:tetratricopeptide (TPR) repeat protein